MFHQAQIFSIETIHCQTKLMGEYARVHGEDGFIMADGTHKITKYDMTFVFWMVIDCLLKSQILCIDWFMTFVVPVGMHA